MMVKEILDKLEDSEEFKTWKKDNDDAYLAHFFKMFDEANKGEIQVGYCNKEDKITTFIISGDKIKVLPESDVFKKKESKVKKLDISKVKLSFEQAMEKAKELQKKEYAAETPVKSFAILQNLEMGQVYNVTFMSQRFNTLNIKIDPETGDIKEKSLKKLMEFDTGK